MTTDPHLAVAGPAVELEATRLAEHVVLVTYRVLSGAGSLRSPIWVRDPGQGWRVRFHQGTRTPGRG